MDDSPSIKKLIIVTSIVCLLPVLAFGQLDRTKYATPFTKYTASTSTCSRIVHFSGSTIFIPENAFAIDPNNPVDSIDIYYREIITPLDILTLNIPMEYSYGGKKVYLESNGMFEILGISNTDTVQVHEDKSIEVRLAMSEEKAMKRMEGYRFDTSINEWLSYSNQLHSNRIDNNDDDLWGSASVQNEIFTEDFEDNDWERQDSIRRVAFQVMEIFDFGLYNYDRIIDNETFVKLQPNFVNYNDRVPIKSVIYIVYDNLNSVFYFPPYTWEEDFSIIANRSYKLFSIDSKGTIYKLQNYPELTSIKNQAFDFQLKAEENIPENRQELSKLTGLR